MNGRRCDGFTLIEVIGVLAIIAILASVIAPNVVHEIRRAMVEAEDGSLTAITGALRRSVVESHVIPGVNPGQWNVSIAPYLDLPSGSILQNRGTGSRRLLSRPTNGLGGVPYDQAASFSAGPLPQGSLPASVPLQARMLLVSNLTHRTAGCRTFRCPVRCRMGPDRRSAERFHRNQRPPHRKVRFRRSVPPRYGKLPLNRELPAVGARRGGA